MGAPRQPEGWGRGRGKALAALMQVSLPSPGSLISRMLQRDPRQRASLEQIEGHAWLQGVDPSPASRCLLPLTSHKRVSQEEHEIIIQAMTCGHIADRDAIQE